MGLAYATCLMPVVEIHMRSQDQDMFPIMSTEKSSRFFICGEMFGAISAHCAAIGPSECHLWHARIMGCSVIYYRYMIATSKGEKLVVFDPFQLSQISYPTVGSAVWLSHG